MGRQRSAVRDQKSESLTEVQVQPSAPVGEPVVVEPSQILESQSDEVAAAIKEAFSGSEEKAVGDAARPPSAAASKRVEVLFNGRLGPKLLTRGDITDDPAYVTLLDDRRGLVREVIEGGGE